MRILTIVLVLAAACGGSTVYTHEVEEVHPDGSRYKRSESGSVHSEGWPGYYHPSSYCVADCRCAYCVHDGWYLHLPPALYDSRHRRRCR